MTEHLRKLLRLLTPHRDDAAASANEPVFIDRERMDKALAGPRYRLAPQARTPEEISSFIDTLAKDAKAK